MAWEAAAAVVVVIVAAVVVVVGVTRAEGTRGTRGFEPALAAVAAAAAAVALGLVEVAAAGGAEAFLKEARPPCRLIWTTIKAALSLPHRVVLGIVPRIVTVPGVVRWTPPRTVPQWVASSGGTVPLPESAPPPKVGPRSPSV